MTAKLPKRAKKRGFVPSIDGWIYFISCGSQYVKVGYSRSEPSGRLAKMQTCNPVELKLIHSNFTKEVRFHEKTLHELFGAENVRGEWFYNAARVKEFIELMDKKPYSECFNEMVNKYYIPKHNGGQKRRNEWERKQEVLASIAA